MEPSGGRGPASTGVALGLVVCVVGLLAGCSEDAGPPPASGTTTSAAVPTSTDVTSATSPAVTATTDLDCPALAQARSALDDAFGDTLDELGISRGDPRAQSVYALVTLTDGPAYYEAVVDAAGPTHAADAQLVHEYYQRLAAAAGDISFGDGSAGALTAALQQLDDASANLDVTAGDAPAGVDVVAAQQRLQRAVESECADASAAPTSTNTAS